jgi:hypothetical protein
MIVSNGLLTHRFDEAAGAVFRLGRHLELDARSLAYTVERELVTQPIKTSNFPAIIPTLDQGQLGSCTGNAGTYHLSALAGAAKLGGLTLAGKKLSGTDATANEGFAVELYHEATVDDGFPGTYPPNDTGSSGLGVCKALKAAGLVTKYTWATTLNGMATLLQRSGVIIGMPWYNAFFSPDAQGYIDSGNWQASGIAGGHELYVEALESWTPRQPQYSVVRFHNSWTDGWGDHGCGRMRLSTYLALQSSIDIKQFTLA